MAPTPDFAFDPDEWLFKKIIGRNFVHSAMLVIEVPENFKDAIFEFKQNKLFMRNEKGKSLEISSKNKTIASYLSWPGKNDFEGDFNRGDRIRPGEIFFETSELDTSKLGENYVEKIKKFISNGSFKDKHPGTYNWDKFVDENKLNAENFRNHMLVKKFLTEAPPEIQIGSGKRKLS